MIACVNQQANYYEETMNTIKYASKAKSIQNQRVKNEIIFKEYQKEAEIQKEKADIEKEIQSQREQLQL